MVATKFVEGQPRRMLVTRPDLRTLDARRPLPVSKRPARNMPFIAAGMVQRHYRLLAADGPGVESAAALVDIVPRRPTPGELIRVKIGMVRHARVAA